MQVVGGRKVLYNVVVEEEGRKKNCGKKKWGKGKKMAAKVKKMAAHES